VVHLHRRAGFAANWSELQRDLEDGPTAAVDRLLAGTSCRAAVPEEFESTAARLAEAALSGEEPARLKAWWAYRMLLGPDPLGERLTLFWHGQFATSLAKVRDLRLMHRQNETFRRLARAPLSEILNASVREPALLLYLDAPSNRKGRPNENLARELMELFTLGVGHYSESDVKGVARALIGWTVQGDRFVDDAVIHDMGEKSILDRKGPWQARTSSPSYLSTRPPPNGWRIASVISSSAKARSTEPPSRSWPMDSGLTASTSPGASRRS